MGLFSWNCRGCGHPALATYAANKTNSWMQQVVVLEKGEGKAQPALQGEYDGYGRVGGGDIDVSWGEPCLWHIACWEVSGKPAYDKASENARDQGFFFDEGDHNIPQPETVADVAKAKNVADNLWQDTEDWEALDKMEV